MKTAGQPDRRRPPALDDDPLDRGARPDLPAVLAQVGGQGAGDAVHAAPDEVVALGLEHGREKVGDLGAAGVVRRVADEEGEGAEQALHLFGFKRLVAPRPHALQAEAVAVHAAGRALHRRRLVGEGRRRREERGDQSRPLRLVTGRERPPRCGVPPREPGDAGDGPFHLPVDGDGAAVGEGMRVDDVGLDQRESVPRQLQLARRRREVGELVAAGVHVRPETGQRQLFGERHAAEGVVLLEDEHLQTRPGEVAGAGEAVLAGADDDGIMA